MSGVTTVYLDLGLWYALGEANGGHPRQQSHPEILSKLVAEVEAERLCFPLSAMHYIELTENPRDQQRREAAVVMETLSRFVTLAPIGRIVDEELALSFHRLCGSPAFPIRVPKFGKGFSYAFGETLDPNEPINNDLEHLVLVGPPQNLRAQIPNYDAYSGRKLADSELASFNVMHETLRTDPEIASRPLDAICARQLLVDIEDNFVRARMNAGFAQSMPPGLSSREQYTDFLMSLPSRRVTAMIQLHYLKDVARSWKINDLRDIQALSTAIPYCDIVVTDRKAWDAATKRAHLDNEFTTSIFCTLDGLAKYLDI